jgi:hypothetical protein
LLKISLESEDRLWAIAATLALFPAAVTFLAVLTV